MKIGVILPSRGLMFSESAQEILDNLQGFNHKIFFSHGVPIPECFEKPTNRALLDGCTHLFFVEDDMALNKDTLANMIALDRAVVTVDYPVNKEGRGAIFRVGKEVVFCGTGCLLVKREVFDELKAPYFRTDIRWNIRNYGDFLKMTSSKDTNLDGYGLHDVNFCMSLYHLRIPIYVLPGKLGQRKLVELGKQGTNNGAHQIEVWKKITKDHLLKEIKKWPVLPTGDLETVLTPTGQINVSKAHARKLIRKGMAERLPKRKLIVE